MATQFLQQQSYMGLVQRHIRDAAVSRAMDSHREDLEGSDRNLVAEVASLAAHIALEQFRAEHSAQMAAYESWRRSRAERDFLRPANFVQMP